MRNLLILYKNYSNMFFESVAVNETLLLLIRFETQKFVCSGVSQVTVRI